MDEIKKENKNTAPDGMAGIRKTLNGMGISNEKIGFDEKSGYVTLGGKTLMKPAHYDNEAGVTYAPVADIRKNVVDFYKNSDNPVVRVSDAYAASVGKYGL